MEHRIKRFLKRYWALLWMVAACMAIVSIGAYAAYTKTNKAKSVVAKYGTVNSRFSSNYLEENNREKGIYVTSTDGKYGDTILISNYAQTNPTYHYDTVINYKLEMHLGYMNGTTFTYLDENTDSSDFDIGERYITATINRNKENAKTVKFGYNNGDAITYEDIIYKDENDKCILSLPGTTSVTDTIELEFSQNQKEALFAEEPEFRDKLYLEIKATPDPPENYAGLFALSARIALSKSTKVEPITWTGNFNEDKTQDPNELDGYNYVIQGMGSGSAQLKWNSNYLEVSEQFLIDELGISAANLPSADQDGWKSVAFSVNSNSKNRYDLQFYRTGTQTDNAYNSWDNMEGSANSYVAFTFPYTAPNSP